MVQPHRAQLTSARSSSSLAEEQSNVSACSTGSAGSTNSAPSCGERQLRRVLDEDQFKGAAVRQELAAQLGRDLEAETGFASYEAYMETQERDPLHPGFSKNTRGINRWFEDPSRDVLNELGAHCAIVNLSLKKDLPVQVDLFGDRSSAHQTFTALRGPPTGVSIQIVLLGLAYGRCTDFTNVLGLDLKLDPWFFKMAEDQARQEARHERKETAIERRHISTGGGVVAIRRHYGLLKSASVPVVLVAGNLYETNMFLGYELYDFVRGVSSLRFDDYTSENGENFYTRLLSVFMQNYQDHVNSCDALLLGSILPLLKLDVLRLRGDNNRVGELFDKIKSEECEAFDRNHIVFRDRKHQQRKEEQRATRLYEYRTALRSLIEHYEDQTGPLTEFVFSKLQQPH